MKRQRSKGKKEPEKEISPARKAINTLGRLFLTIFLVCVISGCIVVGVIIVYIINVDGGNSIDLNTITLESTTIIYATDSDTGNTVEVQRLSGDENRIWVDLKDIPDNLKNAFICTEDKRFYEHNGVDFGRTFYSFVNYFLKFSSKQGGSTITQQLVKNIEDITTSDIPGKIKQIVLALDLEKKYSKDQILEAYLNTINLGGTLCGVQTAANTYFGKDVSGLDLAQCACIAAIVKAPTTYNPLIHPKKNAERMKIILQNMLEQGKITQSEYDTAINEKLTFSSDTASSNTTTVYSYFVDQVITDVTADLMSEKGYTKAYAQHLIYSGGLKIYTTMDPDVQKIMEDYYENDDNFPKVSGKTQPQSAMIVVNYTGGIAGIVGGRGKKTANLVLDRATQSKRSPGSSLKPLAVYAPAIEKNLITWSTLIQNKTLTLDDGTRWPRNSDGTYGSGSSVTVAVGLGKSLNTIAARLLKMLDFSGQTSYNFLTEKLGFTSLVSDDIGYWIAVGSLTNGVTLREMAGGYEIFGNGGKYYGTYTYTKVLDSNNNTILENNPSAVQAISEDTACVMNHLLQNNVTSSYGTGRGARLGSMPAAGKTGTTSDYKDRWFCGLTPYYVGVTWYGYDSSKALGSGSNTSVKIWKAIMKKVSANEKVKDFPTSGSVVKKTYCLSTGNIASDYCPNTATGWYRVSNIPDICSLHYGGWNTVSSVLSSVISDSSDGLPGSDTDGTDNQTNTNQNEPANNTDNTSDSPAN